MKRTARRVPSRGRSVALRSLALVDSVVFLLLASACYFYSSAYYGHSDIGLLRLEMAQIKQEMVSGKDVQAVRVRLLRVEEDFRRLNDRLSHSLRP